MLNRYGLFDIEKFLREQDGPPPPEAAQPTPSSEAPLGTEAPPAEPPAEPPEDQDEKIKKVRDKGKVEDLTRFRQKHADAIFRLVQAYKNYRKAGSGAVDRAVFDPSADERYSFNTQNQNLKGKFEAAGIDEPYMAAFDQESTGLTGDAHVRFLTSIHGGHAGGRGRFLFPSPGAAQEFAETAGALRDDLAFEVQRGDPRIVSYKEQTEEQPMPSSPQSQPQPQPGA